jgi:2-oxoglutarate dehydrogenase E1 component
MLNTGRRLCRDYYFNEFVKKFFNNTKRFGSEGCDSFISGMEALIDEAAKSKVNDVVIGMAHRGRLSTLFNVIKKPAS